MELKFYSHWDTKKTVRVFVFCMPWVLEDGFCTGTKEVLRQKRENYFNIDQWLSSLLHCIKLYRSSPRKVEEKHFQKLVKRML